MKKGRENTTFKKRKKEPDGSLCITSFQMTMEKTEINRCSVKCLSLFLKKYFNWKLITSQYCGGFRHTLT